MSFTQLEEIYTLASAALDDSGEDDSVLSPFIREAQDYIETSGLDICMRDAQGLDDDWFGIRGGYWLSAYGNPQVGGTVSCPLVDGSRETFRVLERGLLTFSTGSL